MFKTKFEKGTVLVLFMIIGILLTLRQCSSTKSNEKVLKGTETIKWDTIKRHYKVTEFKTIYYPKWDTSYIDTSTNHPYINNYTVREYNDSTIDSNVSIYHNIKVLGMIKSENYAYWLKTPLGVNKTINRVDTLIRPNKWDVYIGGEVGGSLNTFNLSPYISLRYKNVAYQFRYGIIDKSYNLGLSIKLLKSRK